MRAISLWQPWASLWCSPAKVHETRKFPTKFRGWMAVHAARRIVEVDGTVCGHVVDELDELPENLPRGCVVGLVELVDCQRIGAGVTPIDTRDEELGDWTEGRYAWRRDRFILLERPVSWIGRQGWFDVNDDIFRRLIP